MTGPDKGAIFEARDLACQRAERLVFSDLSFSLGAGDVLVLRGPNGSGKTSLLRVIAGFLRAEAGALYWRGAPVAEDPEAFHGHLNYVGHLDALKPAFTATENLYFWAGLRGDTAVVRSVLQRLGLAHLAAVPCRMFSAGQRRRLALARLLAYSADLWLLDEPTVSLDDDGVATLKDAIASHRASGGMVIVTTHVDLDLSDAATLYLGQRPGAGSGR